MRSNGDVQKPTSTRFIALAAVAFLSFIHSFIQSKGSEMQGQLAPAELRGWRTQREPRCGPHSLRR